MASTSYRWSGSSAMIVDTIWISLRRPLAKLGRSGRSVSRQVRIASSLGRPSRRKNEPGILPAAYCRSSTSTVSGKKSRLSFGFFDAVVADKHHRVVVEVGDHGTRGLLGEPPGFEADGPLTEGALEDCFGTVFVGSPSRAPPFRRVRRLCGRTGHRSKRAGLVLRATTEDRRSLRQASAQFGWLATGARPSRSIRVR